MAVIQLLCPLLSYEHQLPWSVSYVCHAGKVPGSRSFSLLSSLHRSSQLNTRTGSVYWYRRITLLPPNKMCVPAATRCLNEAAFLLSELSEGLTKQLSCRIPNLCITSRVPSCSTVQRWPCSTQRDEDWTHQWIISLWGLPGSHVSIKCIHLPWFVQRMGVMLPYRA